MKSFWWITLPKKAGALSSWLSAVLTDGYYLISFDKNVKHWISLLIIVTGFVIGITRPGYKFLPVEAQTLFLGFVFLGMLSSHLGLLFLIGFAFGDLQTTEQIFVLNPIRPLLGKLHEYTIFGIAMVHIPVLSKQIISGISQSIIQLFSKWISSSFIRWLVLILISVLHLTFVACLIWFWTQAMVVLIRPVYINLFFEGQPSPPVVVLFQHEEYLLLTAAILATLLRILGQWIGVISSPVSQNLRLYEKEASQFLYNPGVLDKLPRWINAVLKGLFFTFLLWGVLLETTDIIIFLACSTGIYLAHAYAMVFNIWPEWIRKLWGRPEWERLISAFIFSIATTYTFLWLIFEYNKKTTSPIQELWPVMAVALLNLGIFSLFLPLRGTKSKKTA